MDMNQAFPSDYLKASDLKGADITVTMDRVEMHELGSEEKPILYFKGTDKGLVLNKTNTRTIMDIYGPESQEWAGNKIVLFPTQTDFQGRQVQCIRVKIAVTQVKQPAPENEEIPF